MEQITERIRVYGIVQGVGFRPTVSRHAKTCGLGGTVSNKGPYVEIFLQGSQDQIDSFVELLRKQPPKRAVILNLLREPWEAVEDFQSQFHIIESEKTKGEIFISPDIAICETCKKEMFDPKDRRYLHPFINCTCCGPRMTILDGLPYDRIRTSMKKFPMCPVCGKEYTTMSSRRYDAQPVCCNECGPTVHAWERAQAQELAESSEDICQVGGICWKKTQGDPITRAREVIAGGGIVGVKGIGGFHLCCDASNEDAVRLLRERKHRPAKPFAVMMRNEEAAEQECEITDKQREILTGHQKPILLLKRKACGNTAPSVAPGNPTLGVMLPYAPIHLLLFDYKDDIRMPECLVMTSGNVSGAPICREDEDAMEELGHLCDCILSHNRKIRIRADDTVMDFYQGEPYMIRRSRGYAPLPVLQTVKLQGQVLAIGGELKNTFCLGMNQLFYPSPYVGDLEDLRTVTALKETVGRFESLLGSHPQVIVCDLHPGYHSTETAEEMSRETGLPVLQVQHHYAHILSCMAENDFHEQVLGVSLDGTGYGTDGTIWGGEILLCTEKDFQRLASIRPFAQTGGDASSREGWRIAVSMLQGLTEDTDRTAELAEQLGLCTGTAARFQCRMSEKGINTVTSTSAGRLFDAVSAILGIRTSSTFEGEASTMLEFAAEAWEEAQDSPMECMSGENVIVEKKADIAADANCRDKKCTDGNGLKESQTCDSKSENSTDASDDEAVKMCRNSDADGLLNQNMFSENEGGTKIANPDAGKTMERKAFCMEPDGRMVLRTEQIVRQLTEERLAGQNAGKLAFAFHKMLAEQILESLEELANRTDCRTIALSGGCYQNKLLLRLTEQGLVKKGFQVLHHHMIPPNDGGIGLGQALYGMQMLQELPNTTGNAGGHLSLGSPRLEGITGMVLE